ncbi:hypothetical protein [Selenomonas ruminantium]|uniref:hypothetical protein n=1 Tax=Selenomonas ruminantium TaxID=971 RepID=UPI0026EF21C1|nr:hypothetical protein [Selenomonas ruminantium]
MSGNTFFIATTLLLCLVFHILLFVIPVEHTNVFWIGYGFALISFLSQFIFFLFRLRKRQRFMNYSYAFVGGLWLALQMVITFAVAYHPITVWIVISVSSILACIAVFLFFCILAASRHSDNIEKIIARKNDSHIYSDLPDD